MEAAHPRLALILLFLCLLSIHQASSHTLPASPQVPAVKPLPQLGDAAAIDRTVGNLIRALAVNPNIRYREAALLGVGFAVDRIEDEHLPDDDRTYSSNIGDFRDIICLFRYGGPPPQHPDDTEFRVKNRFPLHWDQWSPPQYSPGISFIVPFNWDHVTQRMSIGTADALLKASGQRGRYAGVTLTKLSVAHVPLSWCFHGVENWRGRRTDFRVNVLSRQVTQVERCI
ncbi:MAG: hypothetical protein LQ346_008341 [Caloplaca aetnensis]|nr:MAG: hypothetical protein LQ346_008341 [Caloplaca aetnensis]